MSSLKNMTKAQLIDRIIDLEAHLTKTQAETAPVPCVFSFTTHGHLAILTKKNKLPVAKLKTPLKSEDHAKYLLESKIIPCLKRGEHLTPEAWDFAEDARDMRGVPTYRDIPLFAHVA